MTMQVLDTLILNGQPKGMLTSPPLPFDRPHALEEVAANAVEDGIWNSTACWRGYVATWELDGDELYLKQVEGKYQAIGPGLILAHWFTGTVVVNDGEVLRNAGFAMVYEREIHLSFEQGILIDTRVVNNREKNQLPLSQAIATEPPSTTRPGWQSAAVTATIMLLGPALFFACMPWSWWGIALKAVAAIFWLSACANMLRSEPTKFRIYGDSGSGFVLTSFFTCVAFSVGSGAWRTSLLVAACFLYLSALMLIRKPEPIDNH